MSHTITRDNGFQKIIISVPTFLLFPNVFHCVAGRRARFVFHSINKREISSSEQINDGETERSRDQTTQQCGTVIK